MFVCSRLAAGWVLGLLFFAGNAIGIFFHQSAALWLYTHVLLQTSGSVPISMSGCGVMYITPVGLLNTVQYFDWGSDCDNQLVCANRCYIYCLVWSIFSTSLQSACLEIVNIVQASKLPRAFASTKWCLRCARMDGLAQGLASVGD